MELKRGQALCRRCGATGVGEWLDGEILPTTCDGCRGRGIVALKGPKDPLGRPCWYGAGLPVWQPLPQEARRSWRHKPLRGELPLGWRHS